MEGETAVLVAGDPERQHMHKVDKDGGIHYHINLVEAMVRSAQCEQNYAVNKDYVLRVPKLHVFYLLHRTINITQGMRCILLL